MTTISMPVSGRSSARAKCRRRRPQPRNCVSWPSLNHVPLGFAGGDKNLYRYVGNSPTIHVDPAGQWGWNTLFGAVKAVGGLFETAAGVSLAIAGGAVVASGVGAPLGAAMIAGGSAVAIHGADTTLSGSRQVWEDKPVDSFTSQGLQAAGMSQGTANLVDAGTSIVGTLGAGAASATSKVVAIAGTDEAAGMTTTQIILKVEKGSKALPNTVYDTLGGAGTSALNKASQMEQGIVEGTEGIHAFKSIFLAGTGLTPLGDIGAGVIGSTLIGTADAINASRKGCKPCP